MNELVAATPPQSPSPPIDFSNTTTFTIGSIFVIGALFAMVGGGISHIISITKANAKERSDGEKSDLLVSVKLDSLSAQISTGFSRIDRELARIDRRLSNHQTRTEDLEMFLGQKHGYVRRRYGEDDSV